MINKNIKKLKKYLFLISIIFFVLTLSHLTYSYLYSWSKASPEKGWTISEWVIWKFPSLNPLIPSNNDLNNKYIIQLLYRSILRYDLDQQKIVWDIANCDISSLINIECIINEDAKWSNWENITTDDIISTYQIIRETDSNKVLVSLLQDTEIEAKDNVIVFKNKRKDVNFLNVFLQPILSKEVINSLTKENITWNFPVTWWIYSWKFIIEKASEDESLGITKLSLVKNDFYDKSNISKIIINIFPDIQSFKNKNQAVNVFNDSDNNIWNSISRFQSHKYNLNSFVWVFLNQNKIANKDLRTYILNKIDSEKLIKVLSSENYKKIDNPFLTENNINTEPKNNNFDSVMASIWYKKKSYFLKDLQDKIEKDKKEKQESENKNISKEEFKIPEDLSLDRYQKDSKTIFSPNYVDRFNFITKDDILLKWKNWNDVTAVYVNDYKLSNFKKWTWEFYYRLKESVWNLKIWRNDYKIHFEIWWKKVFQEEITFVYNKDKEKLKEQEMAIAIDIYKKEWENKQKNTETNTKIIENKEKKEKIDKEKLEKINNLDENLYYDKNFKEFSLKLYHIDDWKKETNDTVKFIESSLKELWIIVDIVPFSIKELPKVISNKNEYDMIVTWVHLWYLKFNLFPYLHSSQAKNWYNFSNIRKTSLDLLVEELKENIYTKERTEEIEKKVLDILKEEQVLKTLYTPKINLLIYKDVKIGKTYENIPYKSERSWILENSYIKEKKVINFKEKSFIWFFNFLLKKLYE